MTDLLNADALRAIVEEAVDRAFARMAERAPAESNAPAGPQWMTTKQAAAHLGFSVQRLEIWRSRGGGPRYHKPSAGIVRYSRSDLEGWMAQNGRNNTAGDASITPRRTSPGRKPRRAKQ